MNDSQRRMAEGHPAFAEGHFEAFLDMVHQRPDDTQRIDRLFTYLDRVVDLQPPKDVLVVGCGPEPQLLRVLSERGYRAIGVEPIPSFVTAAKAYLATSAEVVRGTAEALPVPSSSCHLVLCESVLEHVDSPRVALTEMHRILRPGGIAFITTTNQLRFSLRGENGEFNLRFFNWFPRLVQECYVFRHLHYDPKLANYSFRPAVHWFSFTRLCELGRDSGFAQFYSLMDLLRPGDASVAGRRLRRLLLSRLQRNAWLRALALTQVGGALVMLKRPE